jgi:hypothetical protein
MNQAIFLYPISFHTWWHRVIRPSSLPVNLVSYRMSMYVHLFPIRKYQKYHNNHVTQHEEHRRPIEITQIFNRPFGIKNMANGRLLRWEQKLCHLIYFTSVYRQMLKTKSCYHTCKITIMVVVLTFCIISDDNIELLQLHTSNFS